uniref:UDP-glucosyltransferase n=1 Tax=Consolida orientalis TaxID=565971 RepID=F8R891_9MAGN|nr:UDP-glucosyltransferase [Consolida orientalis]
MGQSKSESEAHVAVIAFPFGSHAAQILNLTRRLAASAPEVTFSFFSTAKSNKAVSGSTGGAENIKFYDVHHGVPENHSFSGNPLEEIDLFIKATPGNFIEAIHKAVEESDRKITCLTNDSFMWMGVDIAQTLQVPCVSVWAPGASSLCAHLYTDILRQNIGVGANAKYDEYLTFIPAMEKVRAGDLPDEILKGNLDSLFARLLHKAAQVMPQADVVVINSFEELEQDIVDHLKTKFQTCLTVGPFTIVAPSISDQHDPHGCLPWLDAQPKPSSVAYISFGTMATPPPQELKALAEGIEASGVPFLWSLKDSVKLHLPHGFLERTSERGKVVPWTPQSRLLRHPAVGVIVTHCGWNSIMESIMGAVPIVYRPFFGDHMLISRFVSDIWKIGVSAGDVVFTKDGVVNALDTILHKEEGKRIRESVGMWKLKATQVVGDSGSTTHNLDKLLKIVTARN